MGLGAPGESRGGCLCCPQEPRRGLGRCEVAALTLGTPPAQRAHRLTPRGWSLLQRGP